MSIVRAHSSRTEQSWNLINHVRSQFVPLAFGWLAENRSAD